MWDKKVKSSFDQNSSLHLPVLSSADSWGQKNVLTVHLTVCGLASLAKRSNVSWADCSFLYSQPKKGPHWAVSCGLDIRSSTWWLPLFQPLPSSACFDILRQFSMWEHILSLSKRSKPQSQVTQCHPTSCLVSGNEQRLNQAVWGMVRSQGWSNVVVPTQVTHWSLGMVFLPALCP